MSKDPIFRHFGELIDSRKYAELAKHLGLYVMFMAIGLVVASLLIKFMDKEPIIFSWHNILNEYSKINGLRVFYYLLVSVTLLTIDYFFRHQLSVIFRLFCLRIFGFYCLTFYGLGLFSVFVNPGIIGALGFLLIHAGLCFYLAGRFSEAVVTHEPKMFPGDENSGSSQPSIRVIVDNTRSTNTKN